MKKKKKVYVPMAVDILHNGHLNIIGVARDLGDITITNASGNEIIIIERIGLVLIQDLMD